MDYLFLQVFVDQALVSDKQGCGNILAGVGPAAIERGLVAAQDRVTPVRDSYGEFGRGGGGAGVDSRRPRELSGETEIDGVPGRHAAVPLMFQNTAGSMCGALLPTGHAVDVIEGVGVTLIDNGMPCVILRAC